MPTPSGLVVKNGSKILARISGAMPGPESATTSPTSSSVAVVRTTTARGVSTATSACSALMSRLRSICCSSDGSAQNLGSSGARSSVTAMLRVERW